MTGIISTEKYGSRKLRYVNFQIPQTILGGLMLGFKMSYIYCRKCYARVFVEPHHMIAHAHDCPGRRNGILPWLQVRRNLFLKTVRIGDGG